LKKFLITLIFIGICIFSITLSYKKFVKDIETVIKKVTKTQQNIQISPDHIPFKLITSKYKGIFSYKNFNAACKYRGELYIGGKFGLLNITKNFTITSLTGLPSNEVTSFIKFKNKLIIGLSSPYLIIYEDINNCSLIRLPDSKRVVALSKFKNSLFIATLQNLFKLTTKLEKIPFTNRNSRLISPHIQSLCSNKNMLLCSIKLRKGENNTIFIYKNNKMEPITSLPGDEVVSLSLLNKEIIIGYTTTTIKLDYKEGIVNISPLNLPYPVVAAGMFKKKPVFITAFSDIVTYSNSKMKFLYIKDPILNAKIFENFIIISTRKGVFKFDGIKTTSLIKIKGLSGSYITSIATDNTGQIYAGTLENGLNILSSDLKVIKQFTQPEILEINKIVNINGNMFVCTSKGLFIFRNTEVIGKINETIFAKGVYDCLFYKENYYIATMRGLAIINKAELFKNKRNISVISTLNGLPSPRIYCIERLNNTIFAGTLAGLVKLENNRVKKIITSPGLINHNWITAILLTKYKKLLAGTFAGGISLMPSDLSSAEKFLKHAGINFNAILELPDLYLIGSQEGLFILNPQTKTIKSYKKYLPSTNITSLYKNNNLVYIGTDCGLIFLSRGEFYEN